MAALFAYRPLRRLFLASTSHNAASQSPAGGLPETKILAVLPFTTTTANADPKLTALGEGLVESIAAKLGQLTEDRAFEVVAPRSLQEKKISRLSDAARMFGANLGLAVTLEPQSDIGQSELFSACGSRQYAGQWLTHRTGHRRIFRGENCFRRRRQDSPPSAPPGRSRLHSNSTAPTKRTAYEYYLQSQGYLLEAAKPKISTMLP